MSTPFVFDPNNVEAFVHRWMEEVGALHVNKEYNGFAFFNADRELLDVYLPDVGGSWVDTDQPEGDRTTWDILADRAKQAGATDIVHVHSHYSDGPCEESMQMTAAATIEMDERDLHFRGTAVVGNGEMQGFMFATTIPENVARKRIAEIHQSRGMDLDYPVDLPFPQEILESLRQVVADPASGVDPRLLEVMEQIVASIERGEQPDMSLLAEGMRLAREGLARLDGLDLIGEDDGPASGLSLNDLMPYNPNTKGYLN
jgi:hypothetical protein